MHHIKWLTLLCMVFLSGCHTQVQEPWVQQENYLQDERSRTAELDRQLDRRMQEQSDR